MAIDQLTYTFVEPAAADRADLQAKAAQPETPSLHHDRGTATPPVNLKARPITVSFHPLLTLDGITASATFASTKSPTG